MTNRIGFLVALMLILFGCTRESREEGIIAANGFPGLLNRLEEQDTVSIVFLGGSITEAPGYRVQFSEWINSEYPAFIQSYNAGVGGTGSDYGSFRVKRDVLSHNPDLVFIEFAVNDSDQASTLIIENVESNIRQLREAIPAVNICLLYTIQEKMLPYYENGEVFPSIEAMEKVARHYNLPSVNLGVPVTNQLNEGAIIFKDTVTNQNNIPVFSSDGVHPYIETGHPIYNEFLIKAFSHIVSVHNRKITIPEPLSDRVITNKNAYPVQSSWLQGKVNVWQGEPENTSLGVAYKLTASDTLGLSFHGELIGFQDVIGPSAGKILVSVDEEPWQEITRFDSYSHFFRSHYFFLDRLENGLHTVKVTVSPDHPNKYKIMNRKELYEQDSTLFANSNWYVTGILLEGEIETI